MAMSNKGRNHYVYLLSSRDGVVVCTQYELCRKYSVDKSNINAVIYGKRKSHKGWSLYE